MKITGIIFIGAFFSLTFIQTGRAQSGGGTFEIRQSVVASGGANLTGGTFTVSGTAGQTAAGNLSVGDFNLQGGFWTLSSLAPTAASVELGGRILTANGAGIKGVMISLTGTNGAVQTAQTNNFGIYRFTNVPAGATYILEARHKRYNFTVPTQVITITDARGDLDFTAFPD